MPDWSLTSSSNFAPAVTRTVPSFVKLHAHKMPRAAPNRRNEFEERWRQKERQCGFKDFTTAMVECGLSILPDSAAPFVTFKEASQPVSIWEAFGSPSDWSPADRERLASYSMIGSDGAGNPICVEQLSGAVLLLDHEDWFRTVQFINSGVSQLGECLLAYMGENDGMHFRLAVEAIDPPAMAQGTFWWDEAALIDSNTRS